MSREGAGARLVWQGPHRDVASYPAHGTDGGKRVASRRAVGHRERHEAGMLWGGQRHRERMGCGLRVGGRGTLPWGSSGRQPHRKVTTQREPGDSRGSLMRPFRKTINNSARDKCIPSSEWRLENWPLLSNHLMTPKRAEGAHSGPSSSFPSLHRGL